jgi:hypothetical protein
MQPETIALFMQKRPDVKLGFGVLGSDQGHHFGSFLFGENVSAHF